MNKRYDNARYKVLDAEGNHVNAVTNWFSLNLDGSDPHAFEALAAYADSVAVENPELANDLWDLIPE